MKSKYLSRRNSFAGAIIIAFSSTFVSHSKAASGDWNVDADGNWSNSSNWNPAVVPGTAAGDVVNLNFDITTEGRTIIIDTAVRLGTLNIGDPDGSHAYTLALSSGSLTFDNGASPAQLNKTIGFNAATITAPAVLSSNLNVSNITNGNLNLDGVISGARSISINNSGAGITTLSGENTFSGGLAILNGTVSGTTSTEAFGSGSILLGDTSGSANAVVRSDENIIFANPVVVRSGSSGNTLTIIGSGGGGSAENGVGATARYRGGITLNRGLTLDSSDGTLIFESNAIIGSSTLTITNSSATQNLRGYRVAIGVSNPDFTGDIDILAGSTLRLTNNAALSANNTVKVRAGSLFENLVIQTIGGLNDDGGSGGTVTVVSDNRVLTLAGSGSYSFNGNIEDYQQGDNLRVLTLVKSGTGTQALGGTNAYSGNTTLNGGVLKLESADALPGGIAAIGGTSALRFNSGGVIGLTAASGDFNRSIQGLTPGAENVGWTNGGQGGFAAFGGDRSVNFGGEEDPITWIPNQGVLGSTLIFSHSSADSKITIVNPINLGGFPRTVLVNDGSAAVDGEFSGVISGGGELNKTGAGTLELTADNTYGAATNVQAGTLLIKGLHTGRNNNVTVSSGASLIVESTGQLAFAPTANGTSNKITGAGSVTLNGTLFFGLGGADLTDGNSWTIVDAPGATSNLVGVASFPALTWNESSSGVWKAVDSTNTWTYSESSGTLSLAVSDSVTFESWAIANGISGAAFDDDADNDGIPNGVEYAIGGNPTSFTAPATLVPAGANFTLTFSKGVEAAADPQIVYAFETSTDLAEWTTVAPTTEDGTSVSYTLVKGGLKKFVRLKINRVTP